MLIVVFALITGQCEKTALPNGGTSIQCGGPKSNDRKNITRVGILNQFTGLKSPVII